jgi:hypothetical protein
MLLARHHAPLLSSTPAYRPNLALVRRAVRFHWEPRALACDGKPSWRTGTPCKSGSTPRRAPGHQAPWPVPGRSRWPALRCLAAPVPVAKMPGLLGTSYRRLIAAAPSSARLPCPWPEIYRERGPPADRRRGVRPRKTLGRWEPGQMQAAGAPTKRARARSQALKCISLEGAAAISSGR